MKLQPERGLAARPGPDELIEVMCLSRCNQLVPDQMRAVDEKIEAKTCLGCTDHR